VAVIVVFLNDTTLRGRKPLFLGWFDWHAAPTEIAAAAAAPHQRAAGVHLHHLNRGDRRRRQQLAQIAASA
jgi:hypothetical protein